MRRADRPAPTALLALLSLLPSALLGDDDQAQRAHATQTPPQFEYLQKRWSINQGVKTLTPQQAAADLDQLELRLTGEFSYLTLRGVDHRGALDAIRAGLADGIPQDAFAVQIMKLLALFGDAHSRVREVERDSGRDLESDELLGGAFAPVVFDVAAGRLIAFDANRRPLAGDLLLVRSLDGRPVADWLEAAGRCAPASTPALHHALCARLLRHVEFVRHELDLPRGGPLRFELESPDGRSASIVRPLSPVPVTARPRAARPPELPDIGYLALRRMESGAAAQQVLASLAALRDKPGLILDCRDNGGGSRELIAALASWCAPLDAAPRVVNAARLRVGPQRRADDDALADRQLYLCDDPRWSQGERAAIQRFRDAFQPGWPPSTEGFSELYVFIPALTPPSDHVPPRHVAVLMNERCFSATEILLGALKGLPNVTLLGARSGGGSGRARRVELRESGIELQLSSMVSYQPDGQLYDGNGVQPDVEVAETESDVLGSSDTQLDAAIRLVREKLGQR